MVGTVLKVCKQKRNDLLTQFFFSNQQLPEMLRYVSRKQNQIRRYYNASALLRSFDIVEKKLVKYLNCIGKLPFEVDIDGHYQYYISKTTAAPTPK